MDSGNRRNNNRRDSRGNRRNNRGREERRYEREVIEIRRVAKVTTGGRRLRFSAMVVVGNKKGSVGVGLGRGGDTRAAIDKGARIAEKNMIKVQLAGDTIPHEITVKKGSAKVMLRPAKLGTGMIAGSSPRKVLELCGVDNVYAKVLGSNNMVANTYATFEALKGLRSKRVLAKMTKMQERLGIKEEMDKEKREKEMRQRKIQENERNNESRDNRRGGKRKSVPSFKKAEPKKEVKVEDKKVTKEEPKKEEKKVVRVTQKESK